MRLVVLALLFILMSIKADAEVTELPSVGDSSVVIINRGDRTISFSIRPKDGNWSNQTVESGINTKISCDQCTTESFEILVQTESRSVSYDLPSGQRFTIEWNAGSGLWDVFHVPE